MPLAPVLSSLGGWPLLALGVLFAYPAYIAIMAGVLRLIGAPKSEVIKWALRQADRQRLKN